MISKAKSTNHPFLADYLQKLQNGEPPDVNARDANPYSKGQTVAMQAASLGDPAIFNLILKQNPDLNTIDSIYHRPPITFAIHFGNLDIVNILLERGVDLTIKSDYFAHQPPSTGKTPLTFAFDCYNNEKSPKKDTYQAIIYALVAKGAPPINPMIISIGDGIFL
jgi:ankyrin repeat protein